MIAFLPTLGFQEMAVLLVLGILLFGRNLPDVGRTLGKTVAQLRRGMQDFKDQMDRDESIRDLRNSVRETRNEVARIGTVPRALANPGNALREAARDVLAPAPDDEQQAPPDATSAAATDPHAEGTPPDEPKREGADGTPPHGGNG